MSRQHARAIAILGIVIIGFYWKFLLTRQFSLLTGFEASNQAYAWYHFAVVSLKHFEWPRWDPYSFCGRSFLGEMQTGAFYPLNLLLALLPLNQQGLFSPALYHYVYAVSHLMAAYFMFCLSRHGFELGFSASLLSGVCFSLGGFLSRLGGWPHLYQTAAWLPLILWLFLMSVRSARLQHALFLSASSGLALGMSALAGGLHLVFMHVIVLVSAGLAHALSGRADGRGWTESLRTALLAGVALLIGFGSSAVQLLPSLEYSHLAMRYLGHGSMLAGEKIPYHILTDNLYPTALLGLLFGSPATGVTSGENISAYMGVLPVGLAVVAVWRSWAMPWVRYFALLAAAAFLYALGPFSLLHGVLYAVVPKLWAAREAERFLFLLDFAVAILAGFGFEALLKPAAGASNWAPLRLLVRWLLAGCFVLLSVPLVFGKPEMSPWVALSLLLIACSCALLLHLAGEGPKHYAAPLVFALVLFDLHAFDWSATNLARADERGGDQFSRLLSMRNAAEFLRRQPGLYRAEVHPPLAPNLGHLYGVPMTLGAGVTIPARYERVRSQLDMLNVRYVVRPASAEEEGAVYADRYWKVYERPTALPRAWLVHEAVTMSDPDSAIAHMQKDGFDPRRAAVVERTLEVPLEQLPPGAQEDVAVVEYGANQFLVRTRTQGRSLLVMSEMFYPGWEAEVDGKAAPILAVNHALRGVVVPAGSSTVQMRYAPASVRYGVALTLASYALALGLAVWSRWGARKPPFSAL